MSLADDSIEFDVHLTARDLRRGLFSWQFRQPWTWFSLGLGCLLLLAGIAEYIERRGLSPAVLVALFWLTFPFLSPILQTRKALRGPDWDATAHYLLDKEKLRRTTNSTTVELAWTILFGMHETSEAFLLMTKKTSFYLIPKGCFASEAEVSRVREFLTGHLRRR